MNHDDAPVSPRRAVALLKEAPEKLDLLLRWCPEKDASRLLPGEAESIRSIVGRLGTLDRHYYLECARRLGSSEDPPALPELASPEGFPEGDLGECELAELLTRFRHVRAQSTGYLEELPDAAWERVGEDPALGPLTLARIVGLWINHDAAVFARLNAISGELNKS